MTTKNKTVLYWICVMIMVFGISEWATAQNTLVNDCKVIYQLVFSEVYDGPQLIKVCSDCGDSTLETVLNFLFKGSKKKKIIGEWFSNTSCENVKENYLPQDKVLFTNEDQLKENNNTNNLLIVFTPVGFKNNKEALVGVGIVEKTDSKGYLVYLQKVDSIWEIKLLIRAWGNKP
jgi:hypothetical protein